MSLEEKRISDRIQELLGLLQLLSCLDRMSKVSNNSISRRYGVKHSSLCLYTFDINDLQGVDIASELDRIIFTRSTKFDPLSHNKTLLLFHSTCQASRILSNCSPMISPVLSCPFSARNRRKADYPFHSSSIKLPVITRNAFKLFELVHTSLIMHT